MEIQVSLLYQVRVWWLFHQAELIHTLIMSRSRSVKRSPGCENFEDEKPEPPHGNLATHISKDHPLEWAGNSAAPGPSSAPIDQGYTVASAKLMKDFLAKGQLNPKKFPTKKGFLKHFTGWLFEDDLPFTTGKTPRIRQLFKYLKVTYQLPSDTTLWNALAKIYIELHGQVVCELSVSLNCLLQMSWCTYLTFTNRMSSRRSRTATTTELPVKWYSPLPGQLPTSLMTIGI